MGNQMDNLSIGAFAEFAGIGVETVRYYQRRGLLPEPERIRGRIRRYSEPHIGRVRFIKSAQRLGFSLDEIAGLLKLDGERDCAQARDLAVRQLAHVRSELAELQHLEATLANLVQACDATLGTKSCALITAMQKCGCVGGC